MPRCDGTGRTLLSDRGLADPELREFVEDVARRSGSARRGCSPPAKRGSTPSVVSRCCAAWTISCRGGARGRSSSAGRCSGRSDKAASSTRTTTSTSVSCPATATLLWSATYWGPRQGSRLPSRSGACGGPIEHGAAFDVFCHYAEGDRWYHSTPTHRWWNSPFHLVRAPLNGREFWVPDDTDTYLTENYRNWHRAVAFYDKNFDTPNLEYIANREALLYLYERTVESLERGDRFGCESAVRELAKGFGIDFDRTSRLRRCWPTIRFHQPMRCQTPMVSDTSSASALAEVGRVRWDACESSFLPPASGLGSAAQTPSR